MTPEQLDDVYDFLCELYAERDMYSRGALIDRLREKLNQYDNRIIPNSDTE